jgi:hypothetical protein
MSTRTDEITGYAAEVRAALADIPEADREELLDDLEDHLAEIGAESSEPLTSRLGTPDSYAAELRTAYGAEAGRTDARSLWEAARATAEAVESTLGRLFEGALYERVWEFTKELRPAWWVLRAHLIAVFTWYGADGDWHVKPWNPVEWLVLAGLLVGSVLIGMRARDRRPRQAVRALLVGINLVGAWMVFVLLVSPVTWDSRNSHGGEAMASSGRYASQRGFDPSSVNNILPYSKDGKPLKDVLLYDQDGHPIEVPYEDQGNQLVPTCGSAPPITNSYPLPLWNAETDPNAGDAPTCLPVSPTAAPQSSGSPAPQVSSSPTPRTTP